MSTWPVRAGERFVDPVDIAATRRLVQTLGIGLVAGGDGLRDLIVAAWMYEAHRR